MTTRSNVRIRAGTTEKKSEISVHPDFDGFRRGNSFISVGANPFEYDDATIRLGLQSDDTYHAGYRDGFGEGEKRVTRVGEVEMTADVLLRTVCKLLKNEEFKLSPASATQIVGALHSAMARSEELDEEELT